MTRLTGRRLREIDRAPVVPDCGRGESERDRPALAEIAVRALARNHDRAQAGRAQRFRRVLDDGLRVLGGGGYRDNDPEQRGQRSDLPHVEPSPPADTQHSTTRRQNEATPPDAALGALSASRRAEPSRRHRRYDGPGRLAAAAAGTVRAAGGRVRHLHHAVEIRAADVSGGDGGVHLAWKYGVSTQRGDGDPGIYNRDPWSSACVCIRFVVRRRSCSRPCF